MQIIEKEIDSLIPYEFNNKIHDETQVNRIANSIKEFGFLQPIVIDKNNIVIVGHGRLEGAKKLGLEKVPCIQVEDLTETQIKKYRILDNKLNESERDMENLKIDIEELENFDIGEIKINIEELFPELAEKEETEVEEDEAPEVQSEARIVEYGDIFQLGNHRLMCGDSTKIEDVEDLMDGGKADMVYTDPPYGMNLDTDWSSAKSNDKFYQEKKCNGHGNKYEKIIGDNDDFKDELVTTIFNNFDYCIEIFVWGADYYPELLKDYKKGNFIIWDKRSNDETNEDYIKQTDKMYGSQFEVCWSKKKHRKEIARIKWAGIFGTETEFDRSRVHPTQKPTKLSSWFIDRYSKENDLIVDIYGGSGSTLIACEQLNRKCYMMELDPKYIEVIIKRFHNLNPDAEIKCINREIEIEKILN